MEPSWAVSWDIDHTIADICWNLYAGSDMSKDPDPFIVCLFQAHEIGVDLTT